MHLVFIVDNKTKVTVNVGNVFINACEDAKSLVESIWKARGMYTIMHTFMTATHFVDISVKSLTFIWSCKVQWAVIV